MSLDRIPTGSRVFLDANVFIYHATGTSLQCKRLLERCQLGSLHGSTSMLALAEVSHRLMMLEAVQRGLAPSGNVAKKLTAKPEVVRQLALYRQQMERILLMEVEVLPLDVALLVRAATLRSRHGLLTNDSLLVAAAQAHQIRLFVSADQSLGRVEGIEVVSPTDLAPLVH